MLQTSPTPLQQDQTLTQTAEQIQPQASQSDLVTADAVAEAPCPAPADELNPFAAMLVVFADEAKDSHTRGFGLL